MKISGFEKFSLVDFPGKIACTVFTEGCNLRCPFCHNSGLVLSELFSGADLTEDVFDYLEKRRGLVDGVCVSGGEPTLQPDLINFIERVKDMGYSVKLDTNGSKPEVIEKLLNKGLLDYIATDVKGSLARYGEITGVKDINTAAFIKSVKLIVNGGILYEFRTTLISEFHTAEDMAAIAECVKGAENFYLQKYNDSENCIAHGFAAVDKDTALRFAEILKAGGIKSVGLRGYN